MERMETRHQIKKQKLEEENRKRRQEDLERAKTMFVRKDKVIRKNDMITDPATKKIKLEPEQSSNPPAVKQDVENGEKLVQSDYMEGDDELGTVTTDLPVEVTPEDMELEFVTVEEKVDLSDEDEPCSSAAAVSLSSLRNVVLTIETLQKKNEKLKTLLKKRDAENVIIVEQRSQAEAELQKEIEKLKAEADQRDVENKILSEQQSRTKKELESKTQTGESMKELLLGKDKQLASQSETIRCLRFQLEKTTELLVEKSAEAKSEAETSESLRLQMAKMNELSDIAICKAGKPQGEDGKRDHVTDEKTTGRWLTSEEKVMQHFQDVLMTFIRHQGGQGWLPNWRKLLPIFKMCRLVSKSWKKYVDFILQHDPSHFNLFEVRNASLRFNATCIPLPLLFSTENTLIDNDNQSYLDLRKFLQHSEMMAPLLNSAPTRHILISQDFSCWEDTSRWQIVSKYLQQFGQQVWYLTVNISVGETVESLKLTIQNLRQILELVPNIRSLAVRTTTWSKFVGNETKLEQPSFPHLKHLETFVFRGHYDLFKCILATNQHIRRLEFFEDCICKTVFTNDDHWTENLTLQNLSHVSLYARSHQQSWKRIVGFNMKLERLRLQFLKKSNSKSVDDLIRGLQNVGNTLKYLILELPHAEEMMLAGGKVNLPVLTDLHIISKAWEPTNWKSFLVQLEVLESFTFEQILFKQPSVIQKKTFVEHVNNFRDKTDWMKMLKLRLVTMIVNVVHNREVHYVGKPVLVTVKRAKNDVLRFNLVNIEESEIDEILAS